jgi:hypothetical protein
MSDSNAAPTSAGAEGVSGTAGQPVNAGVLLGGNPLKQQLNRSVSLAKKFVFGQAKENSRDAWDKEVRGDCDLFKMITYVSLSAEQSALIRNSIPTCFLLPFKAAHPRRQYT